MILPDLTNIDYVTCTHSASSKYWGVGNVYDVYQDSDNDFYIIDDFDGSPHEQGAILAMNFEVTYSGDSNINQEDKVVNPSHYIKFDRNMIIDMASSSTIEEWKGFCRNTFKKYRYRLGDKDDMQQDFDKSNEVMNMYKKYKSYCRELTKEEALTKAKELIKKHGLEL